jgi:hypothetical protein
MIEIDFAFDDSQIEQLTRIPELLRMQPAQRCLKAMAQPVLRRAQVLAPDGTQSAKKQSRTVKAKMSAWGRSKDNLGIKAISHNRGARIYVGGKWPRANKLHFFGHKKGGREVVYWGRRSGVFRQIEKPHWLQKAYDETKSEQNSAFIEQLTKELKELKLG